MPKEKKIDWTQEAFVIFDRMWYYGSDLSDIAQSLEPILGRAIASSTIRIMATTRHLTRSPQVQKAINAKRRANSQSRWKEHKGPDSASQFAQLANTIKAEPKPEPKVPYLGLATAGPDPRQAQHLTQLLQARKGRL
jgi:hypothetical protein